MSQLNMHTRTIQCDDRIKKISNNNKNNKTTNYQLLQMLRIQIKNTHRMSNNNNKNNLQFEQKIQPHVV